ncbi:hypothetical protein QCA50_001868 [Cerrena zonata]|uniref:Uncharacterized protein n=1 Tax=Cerrena zonata TaxID=2478898 RepID=A0AAW0GND9_9APHY
MNPLSTSSTVALPDRGVQPKLDARSYPAQHGKTTGLITLSPSELIFTSFVSLTPKLVINLKNIASVQKRGILDGLRLYRRQADENGVTEEIEEKFTWVGGRDDLFTRLVGSQDLRWINVR